MRGNGRAIYRVLEKFYFAFMFLFLVLEKFFFVFMVFSFINIVLTWKIVRISDIYIYIYIKGKWTNYTVIFFRVFFFFWCVCVCHLVYKFLLVHKCMLVVIIRPFINSLKWFH